MSEVEKCPPKAFSYRAWDKKDRMIKDVVALNSRFEQVVLEDITRPLEDVELMQGTGLRDVNDEEIFVGDVIEFYDPVQNAQRCGIVKFMVDGFKIATCDGDNPPLGDVPSREVIDNMYQLLDEQEEF